MLKLFQKQLPVKTDLKYKVLWDGSIVLKVDADGFFSYVWQYCRNGSAEWIDFDQMTSPQVESEAGAAFRLGDKYRCLVFSGARVSMYSSVLTVSEKTAMKAKEEEQRTAQQRQEESRQRSRAEEEGSRQQPELPDELFYFEGCMSFEDAESRYRQLMMRHHPDKGGNVETAKTINEQYKAVKAYYGK